MQADINSKIRNSYVVLLKLVWNAPYSQNKKSSLDQLSCFLTVWRKVKDGWDSNDTMVGGGSSVKEPIPDACNGRVLPFFRGHFFCHLRSAIIPVQLYYTCSALLCLFQKIHFKKKWELKPSSFSLIDWSLTDSLWASAGDYRIGRERHRASQSPVGGKWRGRWLREGRTLPATLRSSLLSLIIIRWLRNVFGESLGAKSRNPGESSMSFFLFSFIMAIGLTPPPASHLIEHGSRR